MVSSSNLAGHYNAVVVGTGAGGGTACSKLASVINRLRNYILCKFRRCIIILLMFSRRSEARKLPLERPLPLDA